MQILDIDRIYGMRHIGLNTWHQWAGVRINCSYLNVKTKKRFLELGAFGKRHFLSDLVALLDLFWIRCTSLFAAAPFTGDFKNRDPPPVAHAYGSRVKRAFSLPLPHPPPPPHQLLISAVFAIGRNCHQSAILGRSETNRE